MATPGSCRWGYRRTTPQLIALQLNAPALADGRFQLLGVTLDANNPAGQLPAHDRSIRECPHWYSLLQLNLPIADAVAAPEDPGPWDPTTDLPPAESDRELPATDGETAAPCRWHSHGARCRCVCESHRE